MFLPSCRLAMIILVLSTASSFAQANGWKVEKLASLGRVSSSGFIPARRVAVNDVGQIAFVQPDGVYVREPSGVITKRMSEVGASLSLDTIGSGLLTTLWRTSVGIDNNGVVYAGHNRDVFRQSPGSPTEIIFSTSSINPAFTPALSGDVLVTGSGNVYAATSAFFRGDSKSQILKWNGTSFQPVFESVDVNELIFLFDAIDDSVVFQSLTQGRPNVARFGRIDGSTSTDLTSLRILDIVSSFSPGVSIALGSNNAIAFVQNNKTDPLNVTKTEGSTTTSFPLNGIRPVDHLNPPDGLSTFVEAEFLSLSMNSHGQTVYAAKDLDGQLWGIFDGPDSAIDSILLRASVIDGEFIQIDESTVHDVTDSGEVILSYIDSRGNSFLAKAIPLPSVVDLVNQSFIDGLDGWQITGLVSRPTSQSFGNSALVMTPGSSIFQDIDLPNVPFQIEVFIRSGAISGSDLDVYLDDRILPSAEFFHNNPTRRFLVKDPTLLGQSDVTFRIATTSSTVVIDGIRIIAVPEVNGAAMLVGVVVTMMLLRFGKRAMTHRQSP